MLVFSYTHNSCPCAKPQNQPVCTDTPPKQLSHPLRRSNCSNPRRFETLGQHLEPHTRACAPKRLCSATHCHQHLGLQIQRHSNHLLHVWPSSPQAWEGNKHNNMKNTYRFTFLQSDGKHSEWSLCAAWLDLDPPPTTTHSISEVGLDTQKSFCFKGKPPGKSSHRPRNLKHSRHFTSNHGN